VRQGFRYDVAGGCWRNGAGLQLSDEAIDDPDEDLWVLLMGQWDPSVCEGIYGGTVAQRSLKTCQGHGQGLKDR
jgi:hypothetical protein